MADIIHRVGIKAPVAKVYAALSTIEGLSGWWTKDTVGVSKVDGTIKFGFRDSDGQVIGAMSMEVKALDANKQVRWRCVDGPDEWIGTDLTFDLKQEDDYTIVIFGHRNWKEWVEFMGHCSMKWAVFLLSLKELVETGKGKPSPVDIKIDNWN